MHTSKYCVCIFINVFLRLQICCNWVVTEKRGHNPASWIAPTAQIHKSAKIGDYCRIEDEVQIYKSARISDRVFIGAFSVIESILFDGSRVFLNSKVKGYCMQDTEIGPSADIAAHTTVSDGVKIRTGVKVGAYGRIAKRAVVDIFAIIEDGVYVGKGAYVGVKAIVKEGAVIYAGACVQDDSTVGKYEFYIRAPTTKYLVGIVKAEKDAKLL